MKYRIKQECFHGEITYMAQKQYRILFLKFWLNLHYNGQSDQKTAQMFIDRDKERTEKFKVNWVKYIYDL